MRLATTPRISVLMPVRDAAPWLSESLPSLFSQTESAWELLAVDDGSTDRSRAILERWAARDARIRVLETAASRRGIVAALNLGLAAARAPLLARMDADDVALPERFARQAALLDDEPGLWGSCCRVEAFPARNVREGMSRYLAWQNSLLSSTEIARDRFVECPILHPSIMVRTSILRGVLSGWGERGWPEDWDLVLRAFEAGLTLERVPDVLLQWRLHPNQATRIDERYSEERLLAARAHYLARRIRAGREARHTAPLREPSGHPRAAAAALAPREDERPVWVLGAGPVGKNLAKALAEEGLRVAGLADIDRRKIGGIVRGARTEWRVVSMDELFAIAPRPRAVAAVGREGARERIRAALEAQHWIEGEDFFVAA